MGVAPRTACFAISRLSRHQTYVEMSPRCRNSIGVKTCSRNARGFIKFVHIPIHILTLPIYFRRHTWPFLSECQELLSSAIQSPSENGIVENNPPPLQL